MINQLYHTWTALGGANIGSRHIESIHFQDQTVVVIFQIVVEVPSFDHSALTETQLLEIRNALHEDCLIFVDSFSAPFGKLTPELAREEYQRFVDDVDVKIVAWSEFVPGLGVE